MQNNNLLIHKLDAFIRKYYRNQLTKGGILFVVWILLLVFSILLLEYLGHYNTQVRTGMFFVFVIGLLYLIYRFIFRPFLGLLRIGKTISHEQAATIIGQHFSHVSDSLLNTLQLQKAAIHEQDSLLIAAIEQKTQKLKTVSFQDAIDVASNKKYLRYGIIPLILYVLAYFLLPGMISDTPKRIIQFNKDFPIPAPFTFQVLNDKLESIQHEDVEIVLQIKGREIPAEARMLIAGNSYLMQKIDKQTFSYTIRNVQQSQSFQFSAGGFESENYSLKVKSKPMLQQWILRLNYPAYLGKKAEVISNPGDITVPVGTLATWTLTAIQTDAVVFQFGKDTVLADEIASNQFQLKKTINNATNYHIELNNSANQLSDSMGFQIRVIPDEYPQLMVKEKLDTITGRYFYFGGEATDDHGLTKLSFHYNYLKSNRQEKLGKEYSVPLSIPKGEMLYRFFHQLDLGTIQSEPGDEISFYFQVWDNDGVQGPKSTRSNTMLFKAPSLDELLQQRDQAGNQLKAKMEGALKEAQKLQDEMKELQRKMNEKRELTWEEKKKLETMLERQKKLQSEMEQLKQQQKLNMQKESEFQKQSEEILKKQEQVDKLFNELMTDELKQLIKQMEQMMNLQNKDLIKQEMDKMQLSNKDVEKELDRMLEQFKQLEVEKKLDENISKLDELQSKQDKISDETNKIEQDKSLSKEEKKQQLDNQKNKQEELTKEFKDWQKRMDELRKENKDLEEPKELTDTEKQEEEVEKEMKESEQELENNKPDKASKKQKEASKKMKEMSEKMKEEKAETEEKEDEENAEALREILENIIQLSKDQENLMEKMRAINGYNPQFVEAAKEQKSIADNAKIIEDSLLALSKRVAQISQFVNKEVTKLKENLDKSVSGYSNRNIGDLRVRQQSAMTHANNLGVMLSEVLSQMQSDMQSKPGKSGGKGKPGKGQGNGGKKKSMSDMRKMQEELNKQLREGLNKQDGGKKEGGQQGMGSKDFARMAAQQQAIRQQLQKMMNEMGAKEKEGMGGAKMLQEMQKQMEQTEKELFNKQLSNELIQRQEEIKTRMLESEKAEKKQEQDTQRQAEQSKEKPKSAPPDFAPYFKQREKETELLQTIPAELQPYFKKKAKEYFNKTAN
jgi:hypothetical protein